MIKLSSKLQFVGQAVLKGLAFKKRHSTRSHSANRKKSRLFSLEMLESRRVLNGDFAFAKHLGGTGSDTGYAIVTDEAGNVYTTGSFSGTADFDPGPGTVNLTSAGSNDVFVSKLDSVGSFVWAKKLGGTGSDVGNGIAVDGLGNVYTTGSFFGNADFDPGAGTYNLTSTGSFDVFVSKLDSDGDFVWAKKLGGTSSDVGNGIAVDGLGNAYTTGRFLGSGDFDPGAGTSILTSAGSNDIFVSKLNSAGNFVWAKKFGGTSEDAANGIAVDALGNVHTTGNFSGTADFDPNAGSFDLTSAGSKDIFVSKLDSAGNFVWAKAISGTSFEDARGIAVDDLGNVYTTGSFSGTVDFDPGVGSFDLTSAGSNDIFVSKLDSAGNFAWAKAMGGTSIEDGRGIAVDGLGTIYTTGYFQGTADFDPGVGSFNLTSAGSSDIFVSKLNSAGNFVWAKKLGGTSYDQGNGIALDGEGNVYTTGYFQGIADFDPGAGTINLFSTGGAGVFVSKLTQDFVVTAPVSGAADWVLRRSGANIQLFDKQTVSVVSQRPYSKTLGVQINGASIVVNSLTIDFQFGGFFSFPNGIRLVGSTGADVLKIRGAGAESLIYHPATTASGTTSFDVYGSSITMLGVESAVVSNVNSLVMETPNSTDVLTVASATGYGGAVASMISGTSSTEAIAPLTWSNVRNVTIDTGSNDVITAGVANDTITFGAGSLDAVGMQNLTLDMGKGADILAVHTLGDLGLPVGGGALWCIGGAGADRIVASGNADFWLNNSQLISSLGGRILLDDIELATLTGGAGNNLLSAVGFSGSVILNGGNGNDTLRGAVGNDSLIGGNGNDWLYGNDGSDMLDGGANDDWLFGGDGDDSLFGGIGNDILSGQAGNDALDGQAGVDLYQFEGTNNAETLRLEFLSATTSQFVRKPSGLSTTLELDSITNDASDEVSVQALGGDDLIAIDLAITMLGVVDGGDGTDTCTAPASWTKISC
jgi:Ca2+-binding RTX toxin-like protein